MRTFASTFEVNLLLLGKFYGFSRIEGACPRFVVKFVSVDFNISFWSLTDWCCFFCKLIEGVLVSIQVMIRVKSWSSILSVPPSNLSRLLWC